MALKVLLLRNKLDMKKKSLQELRDKDPDFEKREKELEDAINEMSEETSEEDRKVVEKQAETFQQEKEEHEENKKNLETEIEGLEEEIRAEEEKQPKPEMKEGRSKGGTEKPMEVRGKIPGQFFGLNIQERDAMLARTEVKDFLERVRECIKEKRALTNVGLTIPDVMLPMIRQVATESSKLIKYVTVRPVGGTSRQNIMGEIPEGIWDEMCASIKELDLAFYNM